MSTARTKFLQRTLVELLAAVDVTFCPARPPTAAIYQRRHQYHQHGLPHVVGGPDRLTNWRAISELRRLGLVKLSGRGRARHIKLTNAGDTIGRCLAAGFPLHRAFPLLRLVALTLDAYADNPGRGPVAEIHLLGVPYTSATSFQLASLEHVALTLLARGLLVADSDCQGRLGYILTPAGRKALAAGPPESPTRLPQYNPAMAEAYDAVWQPGLIARSAWVATETANHLAIPLPAGDWRPMPHHSHEARQIVEALGLHRTAPEEVADA